MKIGTLDRFTNKMVYFNSMNELIAFSEKQKQQVKEGTVSESKEITPVSNQEVSKPAKRFRFSIDIEAESLLDAEYAFESIMLSTYESATDLVSIFDSQELSDGKTKN